MAEVELFDGCSGSLLQMASVVEIAFGPSLLTKSAHLLVPAVPTRLHPSCIVDPYDCKHMHLLTTGCGPRQQTLG